MKARLIISTVLSAFLLCSVSTVSASAQTNKPRIDIVSPQYELAVNPQSSLRFDGKDAICTSNVESDSAVSITVEQTLQVYWGLWIWNNVKGANWTETVNDKSICLSNIKTDLEDGKYRLKSVFTLTPSSGRPETIMVYINEQSIP